MRFTNRLEAAERLSGLLRRFKGRSVVVLALPRGGVVLGAKIARDLGAPLGLVLVRKIGHPMHSELAIGAVAEGGAPVYSNDKVVLIGKTWLKKVEASAKQLIEYRRSLYYGKDFAPPGVEGKTVILVDDGIATGLTMKAAIEAMRAERAGRVVVAAPVAPRDSIKALEKLADEVVVLMRPRVFIGAVGAYYRDFEPVEDGEVRALLREIQNETRQTAAVS